MDNVNTLKSVLIYLATSLSSVGIFVTADSAACEQILWDSPVCCRMPYDLLDPFGNLSGLCIYAGRAWP